MQFNDVVDGLFSGGYLLTIRLGNGLTLRGNHVNLISTFTNWRQC